MYLTPADLEGLQGYKKLSYKDGFAIKSRLLPGLLKQRPMTSWRRQ
jgi:hypothetical protein